MIIPLTGGIGDTLQGSLLLYVLYKALFHALPKANSSDSNIIATLVIILVSLLPDLAK
jgi:hypothetical protein